MSTQIINAGQVQNSANGVYKIGGTGLNSSLATNINLGDTINIIQTPSFSSSIGTQRITSGSGLQEVSQIIPFEDLNIGDKTPHRRTTQNANLVENLGTDTTVYRDLYGRWVLNDGSISVLTEATMAAQGGNYSPTAGITGVDQTTLVGYASGGNYQYRNGGGNVTLHIKT